MTKSEEKLLELVGGTEAETKPHDYLGDVEDVADMSYINSEIALAWIEEFGG